MPDTQVTVIDVNELTNTPRIAGAPGRRSASNRRALTSAPTATWFWSRTESTVRCRCFRSVASITNVGTVVNVGAAARGARRAPPTSLISAVAFTPDGRHALVTRIPGHQVAIVDVDLKTQTVVFNGVNVDVGKDPYNVVVSVDGRIALTSDSSSNGASDGLPDYGQLIIDLEANPPVLPQSDPGR